MPLAIRLSLVLAAGVLAMPMLVEPTPFEAWLPAKPATEAAPQTQASARDCPSVTPTESHNGCRPLARIAGSF